ncbi:MAG: sensor histidine kinase [Methylacidiphilales bacterium]|nr:sensor histidine kinase [Candidatus Methylacidiphilales bacterium]
MNPIQSWIIHPKSERKFFSGLLCLVVLCLIGLIDYRADYHLLFTVLYVLPIGFATIYVARTYAIVLAILSVILWNGGDILAGAPSPGLAIRLWNDGIVLTLLLIVIYLLDALRQALVGLETTVQKRTEALRNEIDERRRLEYEILDLTERERQQFGQEVHDVVCQELTSIAIAGHLAIKKLSAKGIDEVEDIKEIAKMVDRALSNARSVAGGFFTVGFDVEGLAEALRETARNIEERTGIQCEIEWQKHLSDWNEDVVMHLFRIAQEAMQNAVKHAEASRIEVNLKETPEATVQLTVEDDGKGLPSSEKSVKGLGLRIMAYRASLIGGRLTTVSRPQGGTRIACVIPRKSILKEAPLAH